MGIHAAASITEKTLTEYVGALLSVGYGATLVQYGKREEQGPSQKKMLEGAVAHAEKWDAP